MTKDATQPASRTLNILFLDDSADDREMFSDYFDRWARREAAGSGLKFYVECVATIESALFSLGTRTFDVFFVDYLLVDPSGAQTTSSEMLEKLLRQCVRIPVVICSGYPRTALPPEFMHLLPESQIHYQCKSDWSPERLGELVEKIIAAPLRLLFLENAEGEIQHLQRELEHTSQYHFEMQVVRSAADLRTALQQQHYDVLLADVAVNGNSSALVRAAIQMENGPAVLLLGDADQASQVLQDLNLGRDSGVRLLDRDELDGNTLLNKALALRNRNQERVRLDDTIT